MKVNKHFKKIYATGRNEYFVLQADDELFLATSSTIPFGHRKWYRKEKTLLQGLKLLKVTPSLMILFDKIIELEPLEKQDYTDPGLRKYQSIDPKAVTKAIKKAYDTVKDELEQELAEWLDFYIEKVRLDLGDKVSYEAFAEAIKPYEDLYTSRKKAIPEMIPLYNGLVSLTRPNNSLITSFIRSDHNHLFTEQISSNLAAHYLYYVDIFATVTIYKVMTVQNNVKSIDTFIYDKDIMKELKNKIEGDKK